MPSAVLSALVPLNRQTARSQVLYPERVVQFGGGVFLRAFVDWIIEELNEQAGFASSVVIVKPTPAGSYEQFTLQDGLFHVQLHGLQNGQPVTRRKLITCVNRVVNPYSDFEAFIALARQPEIRFVVSNTTEAGLTFAPDDGFAGRPPASFPGKLTVFLYRRFEHFQGNPDKGCVILPCELVEQNGDRLKQFVLQFADVWQLEPAFKDWIENSNLFCNTLVDRIVPGFPSDRSHDVLAQVGFNDQLLVEAESYYSWIIQAPGWLERELPVGKTTLNVRIVDDVEHFREIKVRILNGMHTAMMPLGCMLGLETVQQAIEHPALGEFIRVLVYDEIIPSFNPPDPDLVPFADEVLNRFHNPFIHHRLANIALNSISKFKVRVLPSLIAYAAQVHQLPPRMVFALAGLIRFYAGEWHGAPLPVNDDPAVTEWLQEQWRSGLETNTLAARVLANETLWGQNLTHIDGLVEMLAAYLIGIETKGVDAAIDGITGGNTDEIGI